MFNLIIILAASYWISSAFGWGFFPVAIGIGVLWGAWLLARHIGWFGMTRTTAAAGGGGVSAGMKKFVVGFSTLTFVMMVGTAVIGVSNNYAFSYFLNLGPRPWLYPAHTTTDLLIWVALFFLSTVVAYMTANGRIKPALVIFGVTLAFLFVYREMPRVFDVLVPVPSSGPAPTRPGESQERANTEGSVAERGIAPVVVEVTKEFIMGDKFLKRTKDYMLETFREVFPPPPPAPARASVATSAAASVASAPVVVVKNVGQVKTPYRFGSDGCITKHLRGNWSSYPKGGEIVFTDLATGLPVLNDKPGTATGSSLPAGDYRICKVDPGAWGVEIWN